jgi:DNA repair protein RecN (Recombination protein N)
MLESLTIRNVALFEEAALRFSSGLHVLTGETGAGKSLIVDSVSFLCGAKTDRDILRTGSDKAYVEGCFLLSGQQALMEALETQSLEAEDGRLIISRELNAAGRSIYRISGIAVTLSVYKEITAQLIDLHGQHEHQSLLKESRHLDYLDHFGEDEHALLLGDVEGQYQKFSDAEAQYHRASQNRQASRDRMEEMRQKLQELSQAKLRPGEEEELQTAKTILRNADRITKALEAANAVLTLETNGQNALFLARQAQKFLAQIREMSTGFQHVAERIDSVYYELEELGHDISLSLRNVETDEEKLEEVESRLDLLRRLGRKYGPSEDEMLAFYQKIEAEVRQYDLMENNHDALLVQAEHARQAYHLAATKLSASRRRLALYFERQMKSALRDLNMSGTRFHVEIMTDPDQPRASGIDQVRMLISPNIGEELKPLSKIASGGELSRLMLAMKALVNEKNEVPSMVFDEIDTGVSGSTAMVIARKLWDIARSRQVICVTHLHQLAAMANVHYHVSKSEEGGRTQAYVTELTEGERITEIAKMLGDLSTQGETSLQHAEVLLRDAAGYRERMPLLNKQ